MSIGGKAIDIHASTSPCSTRKARAVSGAEIQITSTRISKLIRITRKQKVNTRHGSLWYVFCFQFASLYNPVDKRVKERVKKMLLLGVTQRSEMRRHLNVFVAENFPDVSELDSSFYPSD